MQRLTSWQNELTNPISQAWFLYDGEGHRVELYVSGGSGSHTCYWPFFEAAPRPIPTRCKNSVRLYVL